MKLIVLIEGAFEDEVELIRDFIIASVEEGTVTFFIEDEEEVEEETAVVVKLETPLSAEMIEKAANLLGVSIIEAAVKAHELGISTVEQALAHNSVPSNVKEMLKSYL